MKRKLFSILALLFAVSMAWAQVTQYKYRITATVNTSNWHDGYFTDDAGLYINGIGYGYGNEYEIILSPGTATLTVYGGFQEYNYYLGEEEGNAEMEGWYYELSGSGNGIQYVTLQQHDFTADPSEYVHVSFKYLGTVTKYSLNYQTDNNNISWFMDYPSLLYSGNTASFNIHSRQDYPLHHLYMKEEGSSSWTELTFTSGTFTYTSEYEDPSHSCYAGTTVNRYEASFTMPAKNVTIRAVFNKQTPTVTPPTAITGLVYDGQPHQLINAGSTTGGTMMYDLGNGNWGTAIPTKTNAGTYFVYYKVVGNDEYEDVGQQDLTVSIAQATNTITAPTARTLTYDGTAQALLNAGSATYGVMEYSMNAAGSYSATIPTKTDATPNGYYQVWYRVEGTSNYTGASGHVNVPIAQCPVTVTVTGHTLTTTYDGQKHSVSGFDVSMSNNLYTTSDFTYTRETELSSTNAVVLTFQIHTSGFENLNNNFAPTFVITSDVHLVIQQKAVVVTANDVTKEQGDDDAMTATVTGMVSGESPTIIDYTLNREAGEDIGTYTITPTGDEDQQNYSVTFVPGTLTIEPKTLAANPDGNGNYWATYYNSKKSYTADDKTTIYKGTKSGNKVLLTPVADIPAGNAVILKSTAPTITLTLTTTTSADFTGNDLLGTDTEIVPPANTYCMAKGASGVGFYKYSSANGNIPAHRAYLIISGSSNAPVRNFYGFDEDNGEATSVSEELRVKSDESTIYDLQGRQIVNGKLPKGMYIVNGKKVFIK